jgi:hypothetical protein
VEISGYYTLRTGGRSRRVSHRVFFSSPGRRVLLPQFGLVKSGLARHGRVFNLCGNFHVKALFGFSLRCH